MRIGQVVASPGAGLAPVLRTVGGRFEIGSEVHPELVAAAKALLQPTGEDSSVITDPVDVLKGTAKENLREKIEGLGFNVREERKVPMQSTFLRPSYPKARPCGMLHEEDQVPPAVQLFRINHETQTINFWTGIEAQEGCPAQKIDFTPGGNVWESHFVTLTTRDDPPAPRWLQVDGGVQADLLNHIALANPAFRKAMVAHIADVWDENGTADMPAKLMKRGFKHQAAPTRLSQKDREDLYILASADPKMRQQVLLASPPESYPVVEIYTDLHREDLTVTHRLEEIMDPVAGLSEARNALQIHRADTETVRMKNPHLKKLAPLGHGMDWRGGVR